MSDKIAGELAAKNRDTNEVMVMMKHNEEPEVFKGEMERDRNNMNWF